MDDAHNQSDEVLAKSPSRLPDYVKPTDHEEAGVRLAKDVFDRDKNMIESSDEDSEKSFSEDDSVGLGQWRGRKKKDMDISSITPSDFIKPKENKTTPPDDKKPTKNVSFQDKDKKPRKSALKSVIHPQTSFDIPTPYSQSAAGTPYGSEDEAEKEDVHKAQQLSIFMSNIDNRVPNRSIRTIVRENFASMQEEADGGRRRQRKYLVALDLSDESVYALEWTIGAVLRNGDTLYAIYAMHEDASTSSVQVGEGAKAMKDANAVVGSQTKEVSQGHHAASRTILGRLGPVTTSKSSSADSRASPVAEAERVRAAESISKTCIHLLRKTLLQVRIAVEVIHCKSPKLMVTEAIDELEPTMVVVGARGQSALKG
jgi:nucleotide-binding universal stress UspA family protein